MTYLKLSAVSGLLLASPWIFYQIWMFVAAGLYSHERKYVYIYGGDESLSVPRRNCLLLLPGVPVRPAVPDLIQHEPRTHAPAATFRVGDVCDHRADHVRRELPVAAG